MPNPSGEEPTTIPAKGKREGGRWPSAFPAGFRSRWMMPFSCAASWASAICLQISSASSTTRRLFLLWLADFVRRQLGRALDLLGIEVPEAM